MMAAVKNSICVYDIELKDRAKQSHSKEKGKNKSNQNSATKVSSCKHR